MVAVTVDPMSRRDKRATEPSRHHRRAAGEGMPDRKSRVAAGLRLLERRSGLRGRRPLSPYGLPAAPGQRRERAPDLPLAPRPLRPGLGGHARPLRGRRERPRGGIRGQRRHRRRRGPVPTLRAITCTGSKKDSSKGSPSSWPRRCLACSRRSARTKVRWRHPGGRRFGVRNREAGWGSGLTVLTGDGERSPSARPGRPGAGAGARPRLRLPRHARAASALCARPLETALPADGSRRGTGGSSTPATATRPSGPRHGCGERLGEPEMAALMGAAVTDQCSSTGATPSTSPTRLSRCWTTWVGAGGRDADRPSPTRRLARHGRRRRAVAPS